MDRMTRRGLLGGLLGAAMALATVPAQAAGTVAVIPATIGKGHPNNAARVTQAIRRLLEDEGFTLVAPGRVNSALRAQRVNERRVIPIGTLGAVRRAVGARYLVYPRVLSVGTGVNSNQYQATIIVNVVGQSNASFLHTRQIGEPFSDPVGDPDRAVISASDADVAARSLLEGFLAKAR